MSVIEFSANNEQEATGGIDGGSPHTVESSGGSLIEEMNEKLSLLLKAAGIEYGEATDGTN